MFSVVWPFLISKLVEHIVNVVHILVVRVFVFVGAIEALFCWITYFFIEWFEQIISLLRMLNTLAFFIAIDLLDCLISEFDIRRCDLNVLRINLLHLVFDELTVSCSRVKVDIVIPCSI